MNNRLQEISNCLKSITELNNIFKGDITEKHMCKVYEVDIKYLLDALEKVQEEIKFYNTEYRDSNVPMTEKALMVKCRCLEKQATLSQDRERGLREALEELVRQCENAPHQGPCEGPFAWSINVAKQALKQEVST